MKIRGSCIAAALLLIVSGAVSAQSLRWTQRIVGPPGTEPNTYVAYSPTTSLARTRPMMSWSNAGTPGLVTLGSRTYGAALVVKVAPGDGSELWRNDFGGDFLSMPSDVLVDSSGDVVVAGARLNQQGPSRWSLRKISGATGQSIWEYAAVPPNSLRGGTIDAIAADAHGDIVALGTRGEETDMLSFVIKFSGATGEPSWMTRIQDTVLFSSARIAIDNAGNALVSPRGGTLFKIAANGVPTWSINLSQEPSLPACSIRALAVDPATGDAIVAGQADCTTQRPRGYAARIRASDGDVVWATGVGVGSVSSATTFALDGAGKVLLAGGDEAMTGGQRWFAARLSLADGSVDWSTPVADSTLYPVADLAVGQNGDVLLTGFCEGRSHCAASLAVDTGAQRWFAQDGIAYAGEQNYANAIIATDGGVFFGGNETYGSRTTWTVHRLDDGDVFRNGFD